MPHYNGHEVEIEDRESHRSEEMAYIVGDGDEGWVFTDELEE